MPTLRELTASFEQSVNDVLGDEIIYTPDGGSPATFNAWVEFGSDDVSTQQSRANIERVTIDVPYAKIAQPAHGDRIAITIRPGKLYAPQSWEASPTGIGWIIPLQRARD